MISGSGVSFAVPPNGMLLVFKLGGTAKLTPLPEITPAPYVTSDEDFTPPQIAEGMGQYLAFCSICHTGPVNPNLFRSQVATDKDAWRSVVLDGALADNGMIGFKPWLTAEQVEAVRGYVLSEAARLAKEPPSKALPKGKTGDKPMATKSGAPPS